jgi:pimeloyl-ACP methyl ester carboxylesterase
MTQDRTEFLDHDGVRLAYRASPGKPDRTGIVWLGGFHSDMAGEKASSLHEKAAAAGRSFVRFDYLGHGESGGRFEEGTIGRWRSDALAVIDRLTEGPLVLVGSSMGGWMALLCALARPERVKGLVLIAPAPDFTERLMWERLEPGQQQEIIDKGFWMRPSDYDPAGYPITRNLIEEGRDWLIMDRPIPIRVPVSILQGYLDPDVPWIYSEELIDLIETDNVVWTLVKDGDHRLSRPQDISLMTRTVLALADQVDASA